MMIEHPFHGNGPLCWCGSPQISHRTRNRAYHLPEGDPCKICGRTYAQHIAVSTVEKRKERDRRRLDRGSRVIIGVDGEGHDLPDGRHIYTLLSAVDERGKVVGEIENPNGLSSVECVGMLLGLPPHSLKFIFMGSYDWTKIIEDLELEDIYYIMHPESRRLRLCRTCKKAWTKDDKTCPHCGNAKTRSIQKHRRVHRDRHGNKLGVAFDWFNGSFTVVRDKIRSKVWDCFKFFQCSFVKAIKQWKIGTPEQHARIEEMKAKRGAFDVEDPAKVREYCREECTLLAQMMRAVLLACEEAGIKLRQYHGAGSIASALLKLNKVKNYLGRPLEMFPKGMQDAVMSAYFGGRFENSIVGFVLKPVYNRDIFSAYPYAETHLPCLDCGKWWHVSTNMSGHKVLTKARNASLAVVHFRVKSRSVFERKDIPWGPLPCRLESGSITFPTGFEGWAWLPEIEAAIKGWPDLIEVLDAWVYRTNCDHKPFGWIPAAYRKRFEWGKDGKGIVMKLGLNACAGKTMQNQGDPPPYKSWIWGGMITATTRSQSLEAIASAQDRWNVLAIATDGVFATEDLPLPQAKHTGTEDLEKPLGNWGSELHDDGVFFVKPGMYFEEAAKLMRARGIGRVELTKNVQRLIDEFEKWDRKSELKIQVNSRRFYGARSSVLMYSSCLDCNVTWPGWPEKGCPKCGLLGVCEAKHMMLPPHCKKCRRQKPEQGSYDLCKRGGECDWVKREVPAFGRWFPRQIIIEFASLPKRETVARNGTSGRMRIRDMGGLVSLPYDPGKTTPEGEAARLANAEAMEEPDWEDTDTEVA